VTSRNGGVEPALEDLTRSCTAKNFCRLLLVYQDFTSNKKYLRTFYYFFIAFLNYIIDHFVGAILIYDL